MKKKHSPLCVHPKLAQDLQSLSTKMVHGEDARTVLGKLLQSALHLEFATVPPYLSAAYSLRSDNDEIVLLIARIAKEEMLHMTVVANLMNAIGISPDIPSAVPEYPYDLNIVDPPLQLNLKSFSFEVIEDLFMQIESPENPIDYEADPENQEGESLTTIGQFYQEIINLIKSDVIPDLFVNAERDVYKQVAVSPYFRRFAYADNEDNQKYPLKEDIDFVIKDKETAVCHLNWIVDQGEGTTPENPLTEEGIPGHYYRFESISEGKYLIKDNSSQEKYSFSGADLLFDEDGLHEFDDNAKPEDYTEFLDVVDEMKYFNSIYTEMIDFLHLAFNCQSLNQVVEAKQAYNKSIDRMNELRGISREIVDIAVSNNIKAGIPFQYNADT
ncbi:MAG: ferritin-like protein [Kangiellaceae bacterium]